MSEPLLVRALGVDLGVDLSALEPADRLRVERAWARSRQHGTDPISTWRVGPGPLDALLDQLSRDVTLAAINARGGELVMLHAAGVAEPSTGRTIALVGPSGRGKTTATRELATSWGYVSDETVGVDPRSLEVVGHTKPLSVKRGPGAKDQVPPDEAGLQIAPAECRLARIVLLDRDPDHRGGPRISTVPLSHALGWLTAELSHLTAWDRPLRTIAELITATGGVLQVSYREADTLAEVLPDLLSADAGPSPCRFDGPVPAFGGPGRIGRAAVLESVTDDAGVTLMLTDPDAPSGHRIVVLAGIGMLLWDLLAEPRSMVDLTAGVVARIGDPPTGGAAEQVAAAVADLRSVAVLSDEGRGAEDPRASDG